MSDEGAHLLDRLADSPLVADGRANLIVLDAIAQQFGNRWNSKREAVYDHVERLLSRTAGETGYFARVSETDFLVVHPELGPFSAQAACLRAFHDIWKHFLGTAPSPAITVHRVTNLSDHEITAEPVNPREALAGEAREAQAFARPLSETHSILSPARWTPFVATDGRRVRVSCSLEPVVSVKNQSRIGFRLRRSIIDMNLQTTLRAQEVASLSRADRLRIDMATIAHGLTRLEGETSEKPELSLIVPLSYVSLSHHPSRQSITTALDLARKLTRVGVICEIYDAEDVPHAALLEVVSIMRPLSVIVAAYLRGPPSKAMKGVGLQALSVSCPRGVTGDAEFMEWLKPWLRAGKPLTRSMMVYRCSSEHRMAIAGSLGATHGSVDPVAEVSSGGMGRRVRTLVVD